MEQLLTHIYHRQSNPLHSIVNSDGKINKWSLPIEQDLASAVIVEVLEYTYNNVNQWKSEPGDHGTDHLRYKLPLPDSARGPALKELYTVCQHCETRWHSGSSQRCATHENAA